MEKNIFSIKKIHNTLSILDNSNTNKTRLTKKTDSIKKHNKINNQITKLKKSNTPKFYKNKKTKLVSNLHTPPNPNKVNSKNKLFNFAKNFVSLNNSINNTMRNNNDEYKFFNKNYNSDNNCVNYINKTLENACVKDNANNENKSRFNSLKLEQKENINKIKEEIPLKL